MILWLVLNPAARRIHNTIKLLDIYIQSIDRGIEESLKNGYGEARDKELRRLIDKEKFKRGN